MSLQYPESLQYPVILTHQCTLKPLFKSTQRQEGAILAISLIVLVILSAAALSAVNIARIDLKIASNVQRTFKTIK